MVDVEKPLGRRPSYATTLFGCELDVESPKFHKNTGIDIVNGSHDNAKKVDFLEVFIKRYGRVLSMWKSRDKDSNVKDTNGIPAMCCM